jgi:hypothetical protein
MMMQKIKQMEMNGVMTRGVDTPQERAMLQGLLGGQQQMGPATVEPEWQPPKYEVPPPRPVDPMRGQQMAPMPQAPKPTMPMMPMPSAEPSQMQMSPMPLGGGETTVGTVSSLDPNDPISIASNRAIAEQQNSYLPRGMGAPTQNETDFLGQFVDNAKKAMYR